MALPTGTSGCSACVQLSTDGTTWVAFEDWISVVEPDELTRISGSGHTLGEDLPLTYTGKQEAKSIRIRGVYSQGTATTDPWLFVYTAFTTACGGMLGVQWGPFGCGTANQVFATASTTACLSNIVGLTPPGADVSSADPLTWEAAVHYSEISRAVGV